MRETSMEGHLSELCGMNSHKTWIWSRLRLSSCSGIAFLSALNSLLMILMLKKMVLCSGWLTAHFHKSMLKSILMARDMKQAGTTGIVSSYKAVAQAKKSYRMTNKASGSKEGQSSLYFNTLQKWAYFKLLIIQSRWISILINQTEMPTAISIWMMAKPSIIETSVKRLS